MYVNLFAKLSRCVVFDVVSFLLFPCGRVPLLGNIFCFHHCDHYNHECDHAMDEYKGKVEVQLKTIQDYVDKMMKLLNGRLAVIRNQIKQWC